jgi:hypothetical protein
MSILTESRKCSRCSAVEGQPHPVHGTMITLEGVQVSDTRTRVVCQFCAMQLESRIVKTKSRFGFLAKLFSK